MMIQHGTIIGAKQFKGSVEGKDYDTCKIRVMMAVPVDSDNETGFNVVELNYGKSENFAGLKNAQFPFEAELQFDVQIRSGKPQMQLLGFKAIQAKG